MMQLYGSATFQVVLLMLSSIRTWRFAYARLIGRYMPPAYISSPSLSEEYSVICLRHILLVVHPRHYTPSVVPSSTSGISFLVVLLCHCTPSRCSFYCICWRVVKAFSMMASMPVEICSSVMSTLQPGDGSTPNSVTFPKGSVISLDDRRTDQPFGRS